jgi:hypothetical protein
LAQSFEHAMATLLPGEICMVSANGFLDLRANTHHRIQRRHRLLEDHRDFAAAHRTPRLFVQLRQIALVRPAALQHRGSGNARPRWQQSHQRQCQHGLPAA